MIWRGPGILFNRGNLFRAVLTGAEATRPADAIGTSMGIGLDVDCRFLILASPARPLVRGHNIVRYRLLAFNAVKKLLRNDRSLCLRLHGSFWGDQRHATGGQPQDEQADCRDVAQQLFEGLHRAETESRSDCCALATAQIAALGPHQIL